MEHTNEIKNEENDKKNLLVSIAFIIAIFLFCFLLVIAIIVLVKNAKEISTDPIFYGMEKSGYNMCGCSGNDVEGHVYTTADYNELNYQVINGAG